MKIDISIVKLSGFDGISDHVKLCDASNDRRFNKGEGIDVIDYGRIAESFVTKGAGYLLQAKEGQDVLSSILLVPHGKSVTYYIGGTSPEGMKNGVAALLLHESICMAKEQGFEFYNMGIASAEGLVRFKKSFLCEAKRLQRVEESIGIGLHSKIINFLRWLHLKIVSSNPK